MNSPLKAYAPSSTAQVELTEILPRLEANTLAGGADRVATSYDRATVLACVHKRPIGTVTLELTNGTASPEQLAATLNAELGEEIRKHLKEDGINKYNFDANGITYETAGGAAAADWLSAKCWAPRLELKDPPLISVVIATSNRAQELRRCIERMLGLDYDNIEIIIVDNGADDDSTKRMYFNSYRNDERILYVEEIEPGVSRARNIGLQRASGDIVAFTDDDVVPDSNWLYAIAFQFHKHPDVACVTGLVLPASYDHQAQQWFEEYGGFNKGYVSRVYGRKRKAGYTTLYPYSAGAFGSGNNCAFRKQALIEFGGFDEDLGPGTITRAGEDLDAFLAIILNNGKIAYEPAAIIYHYHRDNYDALKRQLYNYGIGLSAIFTKWSTASIRYAAEIAIRIPLGLWILIDPKSTKNNKKSPTFPEELTRTEVKGFAVGPFLYLAKRLGPKQ